MSEPESNRLAPSPTRRNQLMDRVDSAAAMAAHRQSFQDAIDASLRDLREESARTMALIRELKASPLHTQISLSLHLEACRQRA